MKFLQFTLAQTAAQRDKNALSDNTKLDSQKANYYSSYAAAVAAIKKNPNQRAYYLAGKYTASEWAALKGQLTIGNSTEPLLSSTYYQFVVRAHSGVRVSATLSFFIWWEAAHGFCKTWAFPIGKQVLLKLVGAPQASHSRALGSSTCH